MTDAPFTSYAQTMEDVMLWRALRDATPGFYIDAGAADPDRLSVTRAFYERGWRGIDIEPLPEQAARLRAARPRDIVIEAALGDHAGTAPFHRVEVTGDLGLSTLDPAGAARAGGVSETLTVPVTTLAALCRAHVRGEVHFLKIDVEGAEEAVLRGMDFSSVRPWIVLVEATRPGTGEPSGAALDTLLGEAGYGFAWFDGLNRFYLAQERRVALAPHFTTPPNPFDHYKVADLPREELLAATLALAQARLELIQARDAELADLRAVRPAPKPPKPPKPAEPPARPVAPPPGPPRPRKPLALHLAWQLLRPVLRPLAWRMRTFLLGELRGQQEAIIARLDELVAQRRPAAMDAGLADAAERLLLTLALDRDRS